jgi:hypothetical protein
MQQCVYAVTGNRRLEGWSQAAISNSKMWAQADIIKGIDVGWIFKPVAHMAMLVRANTRPGH